MDVPAVLNAIMDASGWTQIQLAQRLGANQNDVSRWLNKGRQPRGYTMENIRSLALEYGVLKEGISPSQSSTDVRAELAEIFADLVKADVAVQRVAVKLLRRTVYGPSKSRPINTNGST